jgi:cephalosporin-C deacetylase-like acetyl esterase
MTPIRVPAVRAGRSLGVLLVAAALAGCGQAATTTPGPTPIPSATEAAAITSKPSVEPTATPMPTLRTAYDLPPYKELVKLFDYDTTEPLSYKVTYEELQDGVTVQDITYPNGGFGVFGKLVTPDGKGPFPAVVYAAGYTVSPSFFLPEMVAFAREGYAGLAIGNRFGLELYSTLDTTADIEGYAHYVTDLRRGLDLLGTIPQIDAKRIGFVGHSLGCAAGSILSGLEARISTYVLMACGGYVSDPAWSYCATDACFSATDEDRSQYQERLAVLDPVNYVGRGGGAAFLLQASKTDQVALESNVVALFDAAPQPKSLTWYEREPSEIMYDRGGHSLGCVTFGSCDPALPAFADHRAWLKEHV